MEEKKLLRCIEQIKHKDMEILKTATDWAKAEIFSSTFFILFGVIFVVATIGFWQLGKTELAKAFVFPTLVAGILLMVIGVGLIFSNKSRLSSFETDYNTDTSAFVQSEVARADKTIAEFQTVVFKVIPIIIVIAALVFIFIDRPIWRAISMATIAMMVIIIMVDTNSNARMKAYKTEMVAAEKSLENQG